jgi:hypothetical protein
VSLKLLRGGKRQQGAGKGRRLSARARRGRAQEEGMIIPVRCFTCGKVSASIISGAASRAASVRL